MIFLYTYFGSTHKGRVARFFKRKEIILLCSSISILAGSTLLNLLDKNGNRLLVSMCTEVYGALKNQKSMCCDSRRTELKARWVEIEGVESFPQLNEVFVYSSESIFIFILHSFSRVLHDRTF